MDEYDARELARNHDLNVTGVIGILLKANKIGRLDNPRRQLDQLRESGFWISDELYEKINNRLNNIQ